MGLFGKGKEKRRPPAGKAGARVPARAGAGTATPARPGSRPPGGKKGKGKGRGKGKGSRFVAAAQPLHDRRRRLVASRETSLRDLGGLMLEMYKRNRFREDLLLDKCEEVLAVEVEIAHIDQRLFQLAPPNSAGARPIGKCECNAPIWPGQNFCGVCGRSLATLAQRRTCETCGAGLRPGDAFCASCGTQAPEVFEAIEAPQPAGPPQAVLDAPPPSPDIVSDETMQMPAPTQPAPGEQDTTLVMPDPGLTPPPLDEGGPPAEGVPTGDATAPGPPHLHEVPQADAGPAAPEGPPELYEVPQPVDAEPAEPAWQPPPTEGDDAGAVAAAYADGMPATSGEDQLPPPPEVEGITWEQPSPEMVPTAADQPQTVHEVPPQQAPEWDTTAQYGEPAAPAVDPATGQIVEPVAPGADPFSSDNVVAFPTAPPALESVGEPAQPNESGYLVAPGEAPAATPAPGGDQPATTPQRPPLSSKEAKKLAKERKKQRERVAKAKAKAARERAKARAKAAKKGQPPPPPPGGTPQ